MTTRAGSRVWRVFGMVAAVAGLTSVGLGQSAPDPREGLKPGMYNGGEAALGMQRVASLPKPEGFAPPPLAPRANARAAMINSPMYANSDLAFEGTHLFVGNFAGINFYDISHPEKISLAASLVCPGGQGDVSVYGHLLFMSVEMANGRLDCGTQGFPAPPAPAAGDHEPSVPAADPARFRGVRIFDISDLANPKQVAAVQSCRGSHTHTLVIDPKDNEDIYLYISGTSFVRPAAELAGCSGGHPKNDAETSLFRIDVVKVPLAHPEHAAIVSSPRIFTDSQTGDVNGLWRGGNHGEGTQTTPVTNACHDITVYSAIGLAAGACSGNGILLNISDPVHPVRMDAASDPNYAYWHSASFSNDGTKVVFTDEWGGGVQPRCRATDPKNWGADAIFNIVGGKLKLAAYYKMPAAQTETENCVAHNGSLIPVPGRDIEVQAWYQGGLSIMDFTDPTHPFEIGYFDRGPIDASKAVLGGDWAGYWYNGYIYGSEIARGVDVFKLVPTKFLTQNEIDAARMVKVSVLNVQNQQRFTWPQSFTVARAYVDQLTRSGALGSREIAELNAEIDKEDLKGDRKDQGKLGGLAKGLDKAARSAKTPADAMRMKALAETLRQAGSEI